MLFLKVSALNGKLEIIKNDYFLTDYFFDKIDKSKFDVKSISSIVESRKFKNRFLYEIVEKRFLSFLRIFFYSFLNFVFFKRKNDKSVLFFAIDDIRELSFLAKKYWRYGHKVLWLWNPMSAIAKNKFDRFLFVKLVKLFGFDIFTFDRKDAENYGMSFHHQIYPFSFFKKNGIEQDYKVDIFSFGKDKNRLNLFFDLKKTFDKIGLSSNIKLLADENKTYPLCVSDMITYSEVPYDAYINNLMSSRAMLDIIQSGQSGLTIRVLEALAFKKKLISNNESIKEYPFYLKENIIFIDEISESEVLVDFLYSPYKEVDKDILLMFDLNHFLEKFNTPC